MKHFSVSQDDLEKYLREVLERNRTINLTSITDWDQAKLLLLEDSLTALPELNDAPEGRCGDLGTGGGFPGVPLGLVTGRETWLIDSRQKKIETIQSILSSLDLQNNFVFIHDRIEELARKHPKEFSILTARALTNLPSLLELASPLLQEHGILISYQATVDSQTLQQSEEVAKKVGMALTHTRSFVLSDGVTHRTLLTFQKVGEPSLKLPRKTGLAQKRPLL